MSFYQPTKVIDVDLWQCPACDLLIDTLIERCPVCEYVRDPGPDITMPEGCKCFEYEGDNLRCPVHGVNLIEEVPA